MARRLFLHVGAPKTGTSYIESIIWSQKDRLEADGILLPGNNRKAHDALMGDVRGGMWAHKDSPWTWDRLVEVANRHEGDVLVSKEMLSAASDRQAEKAVEPFRSTEVHLIVTARDLATSIPSWWQQSVRARISTPFGQYIQNLRDNPRDGFWLYQDPVSIMRRWAPNFPRDQVHLIAMPRGPGDPAALWRLFASVIGVDPDDYELPSKPANHSVGAIEIELLRRVNVALGDRLPTRMPYIKGVNDVLTRPILFDKTAAPLKFGVPDEHTEWLLQRGNEIVEQLRSYPCEIVGELENLTPVLTPDRVSPDDITDTQLAERTPKSWLSCW